MIVSVVLFVRGATIVMIVENVLNVPGVECVIIVCTLIKSKDFMEEKNGLNND